MSSFMGNIIKYIVTEKSCQLPLILLLRCWNSMSPILYACARPSINAHGVLKRDCTECKNTRIHIQAPMNISGAWGKIGIHITCAHKDVRFL